ncbi:efflux RND transporter periplasmic adaptor subunit [Oceanicoccus sp. KOV_DT_Chl]|uniref:efflux RND transporter periplasmic adaptor subunit n=1 Tax=Oceanicoccus sp. KOV_DT_Chl TaxID=1904639 RepID=UPI000C7E1D4B|nr:efflux RND transporter periplasmic adaptor subunit [Oceanicoccus sp. KOV_DT_Chl]
MPAHYGQALRPILIIVIASLIAFGFYLSRPAPKHAEINIQPLLVNAAKTVKQDIRISVRAQGAVTPRTQTTLVAEVSGRVIKVSEAFKSGGFFNEGDMLLRIDQRDYKADLKRAEAAVASARSNLASEQGIAEVAYQDWMKYKSSVKRSQAATDLALRKPQLEDAEAKLASALADLDTARDQLDRTTIRAPYTGLIKSKMVDIGQYINVGTTVAETFAIDVAELRLALPESKLNYLELPSISDPENTLQPKVDLTADIGGSRHHWQGNIVRTEGIFDERSRVLFAVAEIEDPYGLQQPRAQALRIGTFVDVNIEGRVINDLIALPRHILRAGNQLWVIDQQQRLQNRQVSVLRTEGSNIYITSGLDEGELVCLSTISAAVPGTQVRIAETTPTDHQPSIPPIPEDVPANQENGLEIAPAPDQAQPLDPKTAHKDQAA